MPLDDEQKKGVIELVKDLVSKPTTIFIIPIAMLLSSFYYFGFKITTIQDAVVLAVIFLISVFSCYKLFTANARKEGEEIITKDTSAKLDDILQVMKLLERDIHIIEQSGVFNVAKSKDNLRLLFRYRTQLFIFKLERVFLAAYTELGPFNDNNNTSASVVKSYLDKLNTKFKLELDYFFTDLNSILSNERDLDQKTKEQLKTESEETFKLLLECLEDIKHNDKIDALMQHTSILQNKLSKILLNALEEWNKTPVVI